MFLAILNKVKEFFIRIVKDETFHSKIMIEKVKAVQNGRMQIADLSYLQNVSKDEFVLGSAGVNVFSRAFAFGSDNYSFASANSSLKAWSIDDSTGNGIGLAQASGDNATANLVTVGDGDIVIGINKSKSYENTALVSGSVIAIDLPYQVNFSDFLENLF